MPRNGRLCFHVPMKLAVILKALLPTRRLRCCANGVVNHRNVYCQTRRSTVAGAGMDISRKFFSIRHENAFIGNGRNEALLGWFWIGAGLTRSRCQNHDD